MADAQSKLAQLQANGAQSGTAFPNDPIRALRQAAVKREGGTMAAAQFSVEQAQQHLDDTTSNLEQRLASLQQEHARFEQSEKEALAQIDKAYAGVTKATEVFQWFVRDDEVVPAWSGVESTKQDSNTMRLDRDWSQTMWDLLNHRGNDHVHAVLNVPNNIVPGQRPTAPESATATTQATDADRASSN